MFRRLIYISGMILIILFGAGLAITWIAKNRSLQDRVYCQNNLRQLAQFAEAYSLVDPGKPLFASENAREKLDKETINRLSKDRTAASIPPGTVVNSALPVEKRLSWLTYMLPNMGLPAPLLLVDKEPWDSKANRRASLTRLASLTCYGRPAAVDPSQPAQTQYLGAAGVGETAPRDPWLADDKPSANAGCFRYDAATRFALIADGLSQTILFTEISPVHAGPWLQGGRSTLSILDTSVKTQIGLQAPFGGNHPNIAFFAMADGSVRPFSERTMTVVLHNLMTIAGGDSDPMPGEIP